MCLIRCKALVNPSALHKSVGVYSNRMSLFLTASRTVDCLMRKCRLRAEILSELAVINAAVLSTSVTISPFSVWNSSSNNGRIHWAATANVVSAAYSASQVLYAVTVCFLDHQATGDPLAKKKTALVPLGELVLPVTVRVLMHGQSCKKK